MRRPSARATDDVIYEYCSLTDQSMFYTIRRVFLSDEEV